MIIDDTLFLVASIMQLLFGLIIFLCIFLLWLEGFPNSIIFALKIRKECNFANCNFIDGLFLYKILNDTLRQIYRETKFTKISIHTQHSITFNQYKIKIKLFFNINQSREKALFIISHNVCG